MRKKNTSKTGNPSGTAVIMFTDIVGYSRMMSADPTGTLDFLRKHDAILNKIIKSSSGRVVKTIGDSFMAEYASCEKALGAAISIQRMMEKEFAGQKRIRIGIHTGEAMRKGSDLFGHDVNIASRLESQAPHGGICVSEEFFNVVAMPKGIRHEKTGLLNLKNIPQPVKAYWIYPTDEVFRAVMDKRRKEKYKKGIIRGLLAASLAVIVFGFIYLKPYAADLVERQKWTPWITEKLNSTAAFDNNWIRSYDYELDDKKKEMLLVNDNPVRPRKELPKQPFMAIIDLKMSNEKKSAYMNFMAATDMKSVTPYYPASGHKIYYEWDGLFSYIELQPGFALLNAGTGNHLLKMEDSASKIEPFRGSGSVHRIIITYDRDVLIFKLDQGKPVKAMIKKLKKGEGGTFKFGFYGRNMLVKKVEIYTRKLYKDLDLLTAADNYRLEGRIKQSVDSYDELIRRAITPEDRSMYLYKKACALLDSGDMENTIITLKSVIAEKTNDYSYYAAYDLAELMTADSGTVNNETKKLLDFALSAPSYNPAKYSAQTLRLKLLLKSENDYESAETLAKEIIFQPDAPNAQEAFNTLFNVIYKSENSGAQIRAYDTLDRIIANRSRGDNGLYNPAITKKLKMLYAAKMKDKFFETATEPFLNYDYLLKAYRREIFVMIMAASASEGFTQAQQNWCAVLEKKYPKKTATAYKSMMNDCGLIMSSNPAIWKGKNPLAFSSYSFLVNRVTYSKGKRINNGVFFNADCESVASYGSSAQNKPYINEDQTVTYDFDTGKDWGCGISILPNFGGKTITGGANMNGNERVEFEMFIPKDIIWVAKFVETGAKHQDSSGSFQGKNGADGETYTTGEYTGKGKWEIVTIALSDIRPFMYWGNQNGNDILDLQSIGSVEISIPGSQGKGTLKLKKIIFK